ncbi:MAG: hypothetical protein K9L86_08355 [Candidatus Omnitrophica bacterium]|nr:hypothetical protein [Candidatus Omnitrophota bacterium]
MKVALKSLVFLAVVIIVLGFFLPWVHVESKQVGAISKLLTGKAQSNIAAISGFQIPVMANGADSRLVISIIQIFNPGIKNTDKKSFAVWAAPVLAVIIFLLVLFFGKNRWLYLTFGIVGLAIFFVGVYKIKTTDLDKLVLQVRIGLGLWMILLGYCLLGASGVYNFFGLLKNKNG